MKTKTQKLLRSVEEKLKAKKVKLGPKLASAKVSAFQKENRIKLPEEYVLFLTELGNGAKDSDGTYGLVKLGERTPGFPMSKKEYLASLRQPFPHRGVKALPASDAMWNGALILGGDGFYIWVLIVSGKDTGHVWELSPDGARPNAPSRNFLEWYGRWLEGGPDDLGDTDAGIGAPRVADPLQAQRDAVRAAISLAENKPATALKYLADVSEPSLQGQAEFARALLAAYQKHPEAEALALGAAASWCGPALPTAVNQGVLREELCNLLKLFKSDDAKEALKRVAQAPEPDIWLPEGDAF